jgi:hypothetical protein
LENEKSKKGKKETEISRKDSPRKVLSKKGKKNI